MITQIAKRAEAAASELLVAVNTGAAPCDELREVLRVTRSVAAAITSVQTTAAEQIARRERHGDGGAEVLASAAGLAQRDARDRVKVAQAVRAVPELYEALQSGEVPQANARRLAEAIKRTGSDAVAAANNLLKDAQSMRPEQFGTAANRWIAAQQADNGVSQHAQQRAKRYLKFYDTPEGMIGLHGEFDKITGQRLHNRLRQTAARLLNADKQLSESQRREFPQCMADALQHHITQTGHAHAGIAKASPRRITKRTSAGSHDSAREANTNSSADGLFDNADLHTCSSADVADISGDCVCDKDADYSTDSNDDAGAHSGDISGRWLTDINVLARVDDSTRDLIYELSDGSRLPPAIVEELTCNSRLAGLVYDRNGDALWRTRSRRTVSETQWQALIATYAGCFHCGAAPSMCQAHHITPYSQGGATSLDNLIMVCWDCHHRIHHDGWQITEHADGSHTLHPPQRTNTRRYGPAHADDWPPQAAREPIRARSPGLNKTASRSLAHRGRSPTRNHSTTSRASPSPKSPAPAKLW